MQKKHVHFIGICGTAMGAVASAMAKQGHIISGSDKNVYPPMSDFLKENNIPIFEGFNPNNIPADADFIVVGNAMSRGNVEVEEVLNRRLRYLSLPETLKEFFLSGKRNYVVSGTHGKTTTTSMLTWIFEFAQLNPSFMIGGITQNLKCGGRFTKSNFFVIEGDEYDTAFFDKRSKFLHYLPELAIINNIEFDHADIFKNVAEIKLSFSRLLRTVPKNGLALINGDEKNCRDVAEGAHCPVKFVGCSPRCDIRITKLSYKPESTSFQLNGTPFTIPMIGEFNARNAAMAISAAQFAGIADDVIQEALDSFQGVARRQEVYAEVKDITIIDDFAHHPTAIRLAIAGLRQRYPERRLFIVFEPRSNTTRRNTFQKSLPLALANGDEIIIAPIESTDKVKEEDRLNITELSKDIEAQGKKVHLGENTAHIISLILEHKKENDVVVVMSNGGFDKLHLKLKLALENLTTP